MSSSKICDLIPLEADSSIKRLLSSHVKVLRAIHRYRFLQRKTPIPPTHLFRMGIIHTYDVGKAGTDTICKNVAECMAGMTFNFKWRQLAAVRFIYFFVIMAIKLVNIYKYWKQRKRDPASVLEFRNDLNGISGPLTSAVYNLGCELCTKPFEFGTLQTRMYPPEVTPKKVRISEILAAHPEDVVSVLKNSLYDNYALAIKDKLPIQPSFLSRSQNRSFVIKDEYFDSNNLACLYKKSIQPLDKKNRPSAVKFWSTKEGMHFRTNQALLHSRKKLDGRKPCLICLAKPRAAYACILCGASFCLECFDVFHNKEELTFRKTAKRKNRVVSDRLPSRGKRTEVHRSIEVQPKKLDFTSLENSPQSKKRKLESPKNNNSQVQELGAGHIKRRKS